MFQYPATNVQIFNGLGWVDHVRMGEGKVFRFGKLFGGEFEFFKLRLLIFGVSTSLPLLVSWTKVISWNIHNEWWSISSSFALSPLPARFARRKTFSRNEIAYRKTRQWFEREFNEPFSCWLYYKKCNPISKMKNCYQQYVVTNIQCIFYTALDCYTILWHWRVSEAFHFSFPPAKVGLMSRYKCTRI